MMSETVRAWVLVGGLAVVAFLTRAIFIVPGSRLRLPPGLERILRFAPAAALMAIIVPDVARANGGISLAPDNPRLIAGLVAFVVAAATRNILLTILIGLLVLTVGTRW